MSAHLEVVDAAPVDQAEPELELDFTPCDRRDPKLRPVLAMLRDEIPHRALYRASEACNRDFCHTEALRALVAWYSAPYSHEESSIVILSGPPGTGKTVSVSWLAQNRLAAEMATGTSFRWHTAAELARMKRSGEDREDLIRFVGEGSIIVIDDLGAEHVSSLRADDWRADVDELVDAVYRSTCGLMLITTNLNGQKFRKRYGARVVDRLRECGTWIAVAGESMRRPPRGYP